MWPSERTRNEAIRKMLSATPGVARLWGASGPSDEAVRLLEAKGGYLSSGERVLLLAAFDIWNGHGKVTIDELLCTLDAPTLRAVCAAMLARDGAPRLEVVG